MTGEDPRMDDQSADLNAPTRPVGRSEGMADALLGIALDLAAQSPPMDASELGGDSEDSWSGWFS